MLTTHCGTRRYQLGGTQSEAKLSLQMVVDTRGHDILTNLLEFSKPRVV